LNEKAERVHVRYQNRYGLMLAGDLYTAVDLDIELSSHTPSTICRVLDEVPIDMLMFSVNPGYDYQKGDYAKGTAEERAAVYHRCEAEEIGISVMKPFSGGQMLDAALSPFGKALTQYQCMQYALDRPGVLTVLPGASSVEHLLGFFESTGQRHGWMRSGMPSRNGRRRRNR